MSDKEHQGYAGTVTWTAKAPDQGHHVKTIADAMLAMSKMLAEAEASDGVSQAARLRMGEVDGLKRENELLTNQNQGLRHTVQTLKASESDEIERLTQRCDELKLQNEAWRQPEDCVKLQQTINECHSRISGLNAENERLRKELLDEDARFHKLAVIYERVRKEFQQ